MANLYNLNDSILKYKKEMSTNLLEQELSLKDEMYQLLMDYHEFLKAQEAIRNEKLAESNPEVAQ